MPQMAPMNWMILYMIFSIMFIMFNVLNFYMFTNKNIELLNNNSISKIFNWKW